MSESSNSGAEDVSREGSALQEGSILQDILQEECEVLIVGCGVAGLYAALLSDELGRVILVSKGSRVESNSAQAQGGVAAVISENDSIESHVRDTLRAGAGLCDREAVYTLVSEGVPCIRDLVNLGVAFDRDGIRFALAREGAHSRRRILHARGDATGREIVDVLLKIVEKRDTVEIREHIFVIDLLITGEGICKGALLWDKDRGRLVSVRAKATVIASGGVGQLYKNTTNPWTTTGDGLAFSYRAGAEVTDMEFIQFHPTALYLPGERPFFLVSEAVRGEGAILRNIRGERFMPRYHELAELAPRDIVARSIVNEIQETETEYVYLDLPRWGRRRIKERFPTLYRTCSEHGIDLANEPIPVVPAAHYMMGGIRTDLSGRTSIPGLYACGEAAYTGVHGANRLASNSLLEGLVFSKRTAAAVKKWIQRGDTVRSEGPVTPVNIRDTAGLRVLPDYRPDCRAELPDRQAIRGRLQALMWDQAGIVRSAESLERARRELAELKQALGKAHSQPGDISRLELDNMILVAELIVYAASLREESRGAHYRSDFPECDDIGWRKHIVLTGGKEPSYIE